MKIFQNLILFTVLLHIQGQEVVLTPPTGDDGAEENESNNVLSEWDQAPTLPNLADGNGWTAPEYYSTIRILTLYSAIWLFARGSDGMQVYNYNSSTESWSTHSTLTDLADSNNWGSGPEYYSTIQVIVLNNDFWLLARNADGLQLYQYNIYLQAWTPQQALPNLSDDNGWNNEEYYSSIQAFGLSGEIWVFARGPNGEEIHQYDPDTNMWSALPTLSALSDASNWGSDPKYYSTIQVVRLDTDFWLLGRSGDGMKLYQYTGDTWSEKMSLPELSDQAGWGDSKYYSTIQAVVFESSIWLFARNEFGVQTYQYDPEEDVWTPKQALSILSDANGWSSVEYYSTIQTVPFSTSIALLARGPNGLQYYEYIPARDIWNPISTITTLSDANNWNQQEYYSTIRGINYTDTVNVIARGAFGVDVYSYDSS